MLTMQEALARLAAYWAERDCLSVQPMNTEVGAGTLNPATFLRVLGPEPWRVAYVEPSVRPDDSRYGENPNRIQCHTQFQVILKPEPRDAQDLYLASLAALGIDIAAHDIRFVEDNWAAPAVGAWGLGWEVWLDGLEITQFTYMQQAGGISLEAPSVEITYGIERIMMAVQNVRHFKDIVYAPGVKYGEVFGQSEYEMSRYYLDDADVTTNRRLLELYAGEARRMIEAKLPVPAHTFVLKCSHAFNVLDSRGAISTSERAAEFGQMRKLAGDVARLWLERREESGYPLGLATPPSGDTAAAVSQAPEPGLDASPRLLVFEVGVEEMPPAEARLAATQLERQVTERLAATRLRHGAIRIVSTPRRITALVESVAAREDDHSRTVKGPKVAAGFDAEGKPTQAALGFARSQGVAFDELEQVDIGNTTHLAVVRQETGRQASAVFADVLGGAVTALRSTKNMRWNDPSLAFTRPIRWLLALHGADVVPVQVSSLTAGRQTSVHRTAVDPRPVLVSAESYLDRLHEAGIVLDPRDRRARIEAESVRLAATVNGTVDLVAEAGLLDELTYLAEQPVPLLGRFDESYLSLPEDVLVTVMRKHQRYLPVRDADGALLPYVVAVANGAIDEDLVRAGNEAVLRARYEDAAFFYRVDRETALATMRSRLGRLTFTDKLGSMAERSDRIAAVSRRLAAALPLSENERATLDHAAELVKFDLGSQLVTEMTSLAGTMARDYALNAGESAQVAEALYEAELPRSAGGAVPRGTVGGVLSLADRFDLLAGLAATVGLPTGSSDPFAIRRAVLGLIAVHRRNPAVATLSLRDGLTEAARQQPVAVGDDVISNAVDFIGRRLEQTLVEEGQPVDRVRAVLMHSDRPQRVDGLLAQLDGLVGREDFGKLAEVLQRSRRIVPPDTAPTYDAAVLADPAEIRLHHTLMAVRAKLDDTMDLETFTDIASDLVEPVNEFFESVFVMVDDEPLRRARLGLLASIADLGARLMAWEHLRL